MADVFLYNSGSLFQALNPDTNLVPLTDEPWVDGADRGVRSRGQHRQRHLRRPDGTTLGRRRDLQQEGVRGARPEGPDHAGPSSWPTTRRSRPTARSTRSSRRYGETWTAQLFVLGDFANVAAQDPEWAEQYTANKRKYVDQPALQGFENQQARVRGRLLQQGLRLGHVRRRRSRRSPPATAAHYPMLTSALVDDQAELPGQRRRRRLLRPAGPGRRRHPADHLAAQRALHPEDDRGRQARGGQEVRGLRQLARGLRDPERGEHRSPDRTSISAASCPTTSRPVTGRPDVPRRRQVRPGAGVPLPDQGPEPASRSPSRSAPASSRPRRARRSTTRT